MSIPLSDSSESGIVLILLTKPIEDNSWNNTLPVPSGSPHQLSVSWYLSINTVFSAKLKFKVDNNNSIKINENFFIMINCELDL